MDCVLYMIFWLVGGLGLITSEENGRSSVGRDEADAFLQLNQEAPPAPASPQPQEDDMEDLVSSLQRREEKVVNLFPEIIVHNFFY